MKAKKPPHILLIHSDQHRYDCVKKAGLRPDIFTPSLDRLAEAGVFFDRAFSTIPICTPARASLLTGTWPSEHGAYCIPTSPLKSHARSDLPLMTQQLQERGYYTFWVGKYHGELGQEQPWENPSKYGLDKFTPLWHYDKFLEKEEFSPEPKDHFLFGDVNDNCPKDKTRLAWQADQVIEEIRAHKKSHSKQALFLRWDPPEPHLPCRPHQDFFEPFKDVEIPPWQSFPDPLENKPSAQKRQKKIWGIEDYQWKDWLHIVRLYYAFIAEMDYHIGRILDALEEAGIDQETLVLYSTDHGDYCGGHGQMDKHYNMYDDVVRVPLILRWPEALPAGVICSAVASGSLDLNRTILEAAGVDVPEVNDGYDLVKMVNQEQRPRKYGYAQYFGTESGSYDCRMIRSEDYKFVYHPVGDTHEFYDLKKDPGEIHNLVNDKSVAPERERLMAELYNIMKSEGDRLACFWTKTELCGEDPLSKIYGYS